MRFIFSRKSLRPLSLPPLVSNSGFPEKRLPQFWSLQGLQSYAVIRELQLQLVELRIRDLIPDTVLFLEHSPVITQGRGLQYTGEARPRHMPLPQGLPAGIEFSESERGGDLTYHGPGQLVIYPICKLDGQGFAPFRDVGAFLRNCEDGVIRALSERNIKAEVREKATGVWIGEKKVASLGIAIRKWVSYHGIAINAVNDLSPYFWISPCGFQPEVMTRLMDWIPFGPDWIQEREQWELALCESFCSGIQAASSIPFKLLSLTLSQAQQRIEELSALIPESP